MISTNTPPIDIPTTLLVVKKFFAFPEFDFSCAEGPSARLPGGVLPEGGPQKA